MELVTQASPERSAALEIGGMSGSAGRRSFARHFIEMMLAMMIGMGVLGGLSMLAFAAAGSSLSDQSGALRVVLMGIEMTVPMVAWMAYRRHAGGRLIEMAAAMMLPSFGAAALASRGALDTGAALAVEHAVMIPAMLAVMLWRYDTYSRPHDRDRGTTAEQRTGGAAAS